MVYFGVFIVCVALGNLFSAWVGVLFFGIFIVALSVMEACVEVEKRKKVKTEE